VTLRQFSGQKRDSEKQIVPGAVPLGKHPAFCNGSQPEVVELRDEANLMALRLLNY
jgi:hypothetical protein